MDLNPTKQQAWLTMKLLGVYLPGFSQCLAYRHIRNSYMEAGFLNSGPYACTGNTFPPDPAISLSSLPSTLNLHFPQMFFNYCSYVQKPQLWFHMSLNISGLFCYIYKTWTHYLAGTNSLFFFFWDKEINTLIFPKAFFLWIKKCKQDKVNSTSCILYWVSTFSAIFQSYLLMKGVIFKTAASHNENFPHYFFSIHGQLIRTSTYIPLTPLSHLALSIVLRCKSLVKV